MKFLFIADPLESLQLSKDSTLAMMQAAQEAGHSLWFARTHELIWLDAKTKARCRSLKLQLNHSPWHFLGESEEIALEQFSAVLMRQDPPFDLEYLNATWLLSAAVREGAKVFNHPDALRNHSEKIAITEFTEFIAPTIITRDLGAIKAFHALHHDIVIKPLDGMGGMGVFRVGQDGLNLASIVETLGNQGQRTLMAQRFIPEIIEGDKRVLLIGGKVAPFALARIPQGSEIRGNLAAGGKGIAMPLSKREQMIADYLAPILWQRGLLVVGLDMIGGFLTEINVTSPTCFVEIAQQSQFDVAQFWLKSLEEALS